MENPLHWDLATNVIGYALQEHAQMPAESCGPSLQYYIASQLQERGLLTWKATKEVGILDAMPPEDPWISLIGSEADEDRWKNMCQSYHDKIAEALGLPLEPMAGFEPMVQMIQNLVKFHNERQANAQEKR